MSKEKVIKETKTEEKQEEKKEEKKSVGKKRKYLLTINNPLEHGYDRKTLETLCIDLEPMFICMSDEIGLVGKTPHTHIYIKFENPRSFKSIQQTFPGAHIDPCKGDDWENIDYVFKEGPWESDPKKDTNIKDSHFMWGLIPPERVEVVSATKAIKQLVDKDVEIADIITAFPNFALKTRQIQDYKKIKQFNDHKSFMKKHRNDLEVAYIYGPTGSGKSFYVQTKYSPDDVCVATDYNHPFEDYEFQNVMVFEEFRSDIPLKAMLKYLDIYPCSLPHRYGNRFACYTKVYIISNIPIGRQFADLQESEPESYAALMRRIKYFMRFDDFKHRYVYEGYYNYTHGKKITLDEFEEREKGKEEELEKHEQLKLA